MSTELVTQLRFARRNLLAIMDGVTNAQSVERLMPMNALGWIMGHLASQEQANFVLIAGNKMVDPELHRRVGFGYPASTPEIDEMRGVWEAVTARADEFLNTLTPAMLTVHPEWKGKPFKNSWGTLLQRTTYHYFYHIGEASAIRQLQGDTDLPVFVLHNKEEETYRPEGQ